MSDFLQRLKVESTELDLKLEKLTKFHKSKPFYALSLDEQSDLQHQLYTMSEYSGVLRVRLAKAEGYYSGYKQANFDTQVTGEGCGDRVLISPPSS